MSTTAVLPDDISIPLQAVAGRQRRFRVARALIWAIGVCAIIALVAVLVLGAYPQLATPLRWVVAGLAWFAMAYILWRFLRGCFTPIDLLTAAGTVEIADHSHEEMLLSAVQFSADDQAGQIASSELVNSVIHKAGDVAAQIDARQIITPRTFLKAAVICLPALAVWLLLWPLMPNTLALGMRRTIMPWSQQMPLSSMHLTVSPGDITLGQGGNVVVTARDDVKVAPVKTLHLELAQRYADGRVSAQNMTPTGPRSYRHTFAAVQASFQYRIISRRGQSRWYAVHVIERPAISGLTIRYVYPPYTHLPPHRVTGVDGSIRGIRGTQVSITAHTTEPLNRRSALHIAASPDGPAQWARLHHAAGDAYRAVFTLEASTHYQINLFNQQHIANRDNRVWPISVFSDPLPVAHVISPRGVVRARPDDVIPIRYEAADRYGITSLRVRIKVGDTPSLSYPISLGTLGGRNYTGTWHLNIANQLLAANEPHARALIYRLVVEDNCLPAHQTGMSGEHEIKIDPNLTMSYQARRDAVLYRRFSAALKDSMRKLDQAGEQIKMLQRVPASQHFNAGAMHTANDAQNLIQQSAQNLNSAAARIHHGVYRQAARAVKLAANTSMAAASKNLALATFDNPKLTQLRPAQLAAARQNIRQALTQLRAAASHLQHTAGVQAISDSVKALAQQQTSVSHQLSINPASTRALAQQRRIENQLQRLIKQHPTLQKPTQAAAATAVGNLTHELQTILARQQALRQTISAKLHKQQAINAMASLQAQQAQLNQAITQFSTAQTRTPIGRDLPPVSHTAMQTAVRALQRRHAAAAHISQRQIADQLGQAAAQLQRRAARSRANAKAQDHALAAQRQAQEVLRTANQAAGQAMAANTVQLQHMAQQLANAASRQAATTSSTTAQRLYRQAEAQAAAAERAAAENNMPASRRLAQVAATNLARGAQAQIAKAADKATPQQLTAAAQHLTALKARERNLARQTDAIAREIAAANQPSRQSIMQSTQAATAISQASATAGQLERQTALGAPNLAAAIAQARQQLRQARADQQSTNQRLLQHNHAEAAIRQHAAMAHIQSALADLQQGMRGAGTESAPSYNDHIAGEMNPSQLQASSARHSSSPGSSAGRQHGGPSQAGQSEYQRLMATAENLQQALAAGHSAAQGNASAAQAAAGALAQAEQSIGPLGGLSPSGQPMPDTSVGGQNGAAGEAEAAGIAGTQGASTSGATGHQGTGIEADNAVGQVPQAVSALGISPAQWVKLGTLRQNQLLNSARQSIPPGYRQMVRDYYVKIARLDSEKP